LLFRVLSWGFLDVRSALIVTDTLPELSGGRH
jgi:hypothetical protein